MTTPATLAFFNFTTTEMLVILGIALLIFGRRLPEVGKSLGRGIVEFKKGLKGVEDEVETATAPSARREARPLPDDRRVSRADTVEAEEADSRPASDNR